MMEGFGVSEIMRKYAAGKNSWIRDHQIPGPVMFCLLNRDLEKLSFGVLRS